jgi:hypothetical protein
MTPFSSLPGDILGPMARARIFVRECCAGPVGVLLAYNQKPGLPQYVCKVTLDKPSWKVGVHNA